MRFHRRALSLPIADELRVDSCGRIDHNKAQTSDLCDFVNGKLFPYLYSFKQKATGPNTIEYKIGEIAEFN